MFDLEDAIEQMGFCWPGIENYSRHLSGSAPPRG